MSSDDTEGLERAVWSAAHGPLSEAPSRDLDPHAATSSAAVSLGRVEILAVARSVRALGARAEADRAVAAALSAATTMLEATDGDVGSARTAVVRGVLNRWRAGSVADLPEPGPGEGTDLLIALADPTTASLIGIGSGSAAVVTRRNVVQLPPAIADTEDPPREPVEDEGPAEDEDAADPEVPEDPGLLRRGLDHSGAAALVRTTQAARPLLVWLADAAGRMPADGADPELGAALTAVAIRVREMGDPEPADLDEDDPAPVVSALPTWLAAELPLPTERVAMAWPAGSGPAPRSAPGGIGPVARTMAPALASAPRRRTRNPRSAGRSKAAIVSLVAVLGIVGSAFALATWQQDGPSGQPTVRPSPSAPTVRATPTVTPTTPSASPTPDPTTESPSPSPSHAPVRPTRAPTVRPVAPAPDPTVEPSTTAPEPKTPKPSASSSASSSSSAPPPETDPPTPDPPSDPTPGTEDPVPEP